MPGVDAAPRFARLSESKTAYQVDGGLGVGYRINGLSIELAGRLSHGNASPYLKFANPGSTTDGTGGAKIGFGRQTSYGVSARGVVAF